MHTSPWLRGYVSGSVCPLAVLLPRRVSHCMCHIPALSLVFQRGVGGTSRGHPHYLSCQRQKEKQTIRVGITIIASTFHFQMGWVTHILLTEHRILIINIIAYREWNRVQELWDLVWGQVNDAGESPLILYWQGEDFCVERLIPHLQQFTPWSFPSGSILCLCCQALRPFHTNCHLHPYWSNEHSVCSDNCIPLIIFDVYSIALVCIIEKQTRFSWESCSRPASSCLMSEKWLSLRKTQFVLDSSLAQNVGMGAKASLISASQPFKDMVLNMLSNLW